MKIKKNSINVEAKKQPLNQLSNESDTKPLERKKKSVRAHVNGLKKGVTPLHISISDIQYFAVLPVFKRVHAAIPKMSYKMFIVFLVVASYNSEGVTAYDVARSTVGYKNDVLINSMNRCFRLLRDCGLVESVNGRVFLTSVGVGLFDC